MVGHIACSFWRYLILSFSTLIFYSFRSRSERLAKYNQLLRIEEELGAENTDYAGAHFRTTSWMGN
jgi:enolase